MRKFVLIDQSIISEEGHYLTYACAVLDCAKRKGFMPVLCVNHRCCLKDNLGYQLYDPFTYTSLESMSSFRLDKDKGAGHRTEYLWGGTLKPALQRIARGILGARYRSVRERLLPKNAVFASETAEYAHKATRFMDDLLYLLKVLPLNTEDIVFIPTISIVELHGLEQTLRKETATKLPPIHLLFRWNPFCNRREEYSREQALLQYAKNRFQACEDLGIQGKIRFYTDSERLAEQYSLLSQCDFSVLPIPHTPIGDKNSDWRKTDIRILSYLGDARPEKGFQYLPRLVETLSGEHVRFQIQANFNIPGGEGGIAACRRRLRKCPKVVLCEKPLDRNEYLSALHKTDIMLILYDPVQYYARSSGIFAEAMAAGIPALVPADTWMSEQVCRGRYMQLSAIAERFGKNKKMFVMGKDPCVWMRKENNAIYVILRLKVDWSNGGKSIHIDMSMLSGAAEMNKTVDFIEKGENDEGFIMLFVPQGCMAVQFSFRGVYGQTLPNIKEAEVIELTEDASASGGISSIFDDYLQCSDKLRDMLRHYTLLRESTELFSKNWLNFHNPEFLIKCLL